MPAFIKTPEDEALWQEAKTHVPDEVRTAWQEATHKKHKTKKDRGHIRRYWAYVTTIYKSMHGGKVARLVTRYLLEKPTGS